MIPSNTLPLSLSLSFLLFVKIHTEWGMRHEAWRSCRNDMANGRAGCVFNSGKQNLCLAAGHYGTRTYTDTFTPTHTHRETPNSSKHSTRAEKSENADFILCAHCHTIIRRCVWDNMSQTHTHYSTQTPTTRRLTLSLRRRLTLHKAANAKRHEKKSVFWLFLLSFKYILRLWNSSSWWPSLTVTAMRNDTCPAHSKK